MSANALAARQRANEGQWFATEQRLAIIRRLERMVASGKVEKSLLDKFMNAGTPTEVVKARDVQVFNYKPGLLPPPRTLQTFNLGTQFSLGRTRWVIDDASIFSVADGKRLVNTPTQATSVYENLRAAKIQRAALETPTVAGYRLLPELTPGRAFLWGTILAIWGTTAAVMSTAKSLDINDAADAPMKLQSVFRPVVAAMDGYLAPLRSGMALGVAAGPGIRDDTAQSELVKRLKITLGKD